VLWGIETILEGDKDGLDEILRTPSVAEWLKKNEPSIYATYVPGAKKIAVPSPSPQVTSATVERAISDAETLLRTSGATSAVDRIHTALHGYLLVLCDEEGIAYPPDAGVTDLFKLLRQQHPKLQAIGPRGQDILQIVRSFSAVLDALIHSGTRRASRIPIHRCSTPLKPNLSSTRRERCSTISMQE